MPFSCVVLHSDPKNIIALPFSGKIKRMRLHFNQIGYQIYGKEQSRRVPAVRAKPGNPGYGFRRAKWRDTIQNPEDARHCEQVGIQKASPMSAIAIDCILP
jgi:hypothetical protein